MKKKFSKVLAIVLAATTVVSMTACGGSSSSTSSSTSNSSSTNTASSDSTGANNDADGNGRADKVVYAGIQSYTSLNPFLNPKVYTEAVFEPLGAYTTYGDGFDGLLMESWEQTDDLTYTVKLYENIYDSEGNHITAEDVVFSYEKVRTVGEISQTSVIDSITADGDYTVIFKWKNKPVAGKFENLCSIVNIVDKDAYEATGDDMSSKPVGTGPYKVTSWTSGVTMTLEVNENYWATGDQVKFDRQKQNVDVIEIQTISETSQLAMALQTDAIDMTADVSSTDVANFSEGGAYSSGHAVEEMEAYAPKTLLINTDPVAKTSDENLRQAIMRAIDNEAIAKIVNGGANNPTYGVGCSSNYDYDEEAFKSYIPEKDIEEAKKYLAQSAYPDGCTVSLLLIDGGVDNDIAEIIQNQLAQIGITVEVKAEIFPNWLSDKGDPANWDLILSQLSSTNCCADIWQNAFDNTDGDTEIFSNDSKLQELLEGCMYVENHTQDNVNAFQQYVSEQAYAVPILIELKYNVYDTNLISGITYSGEGCALPQAFTYK